MITSFIALAVSLFLSVGNGVNISKFIKSQCTVYEPVSVQNVSCWAKSINRTFAVANIRGNITRLLHDIWLNFQLFKRTQIAYRPFLINVTEDYCKFFKKNRGGKYLRVIGAMYLPYSNLNHTCPYFGEVQIKDMPMTTDKLPATWPPGEYRMDVLILSNGQKVMKMEFFLVVTERLPNWNSKFKVSTYTGSKNLRFVF